MIPQRSWIWIPTIPKWVVLLGIVNMLGVGFWVSPSAQSDIAKDHLPSLSIAAAGLCSMCAVFGGTTIIHLDDLVSLHGLVSQSDQHLLAVDDDTLASYPVVDTTNQLVSHVHRLQSDNHPETWDSLSSMASYGHSHLKPTLCFGSALGAHDFISLVVMFWTTARVNMT